MKEKRQQHLTCGWVMTSNVVNGTVKKVSKNNQDKQIILNVKTK